MKFSITSRNNFNYYFDKNKIQNFIFSKNNQYFSFLKFNKGFLLKKENIFIKNNDYVGFFQKDRFKIFRIVKPKDTLYSIAKNSGHNYHELSKFNFIKKPYKIIVGQKIWIGDFLIDSNENKCSILNLEKKLSKEYCSCNFFLKKSLSFLNILKNHLASIKICFLCDKEFKNNNNYFRKKSLVFPDNWYWPIKIKNIQHFYKKKIIGDKKLEISGFKGQPIFSIAAGEVVFVTDLFKKYGRLIIIKHNRNYLSIYAFNNSVLVKEKERIYEKQQIATMGLSPETNLPCLYFEIRYRGESVNPLDILPKITG